METAVAQLNTRIEKLTSRLSAVEQKLSQGPPAGSAPAAAAAPCCADSGEKPASQREFEELVETRLRANAPQASKMSPALGEQFSVFLEACDELSRVIGTAARSAKPADVTSACSHLLTSLAPKCAAFKDTCNRDPQANAISGVAEACVMFGWISVEKTPVPFLSDVLPGSDFYINRVMTASKGKDDATFKWARDFAGFLKDVQSYVKKHHTTGLTFLNNPSAPAFSLAAGAPAASGAGMPPPPPPPPPADLLAAKPAAQGGAPKADMTVLFGDLNKGTDISKGLKHVSADMKTKNRSEEEKMKGGLQPQAPKGGKSAAAAPAKKEKPPKMERVGNRWMVENYKGATLVVDDCTIRDAVYVGNCQDTTVTVKGAKVNGITIDNCTKVGLVCDSVVGVVDLVNCTSCQLQVTGKTPALNVDKCTGVQVFLGPQSYQDKENPTNIFTSKSSAVNILVTSQKADEDPKELAVPEQFKTIIRPDMTLITECTSMAGF